MSDDFPVAIKTRMWAFMAAKDSPTQGDRLGYAEEINSYLWAPMRVEIYTKENDPDWTGTVH